jgi:hypothetical protein
MIDVTVRRRFAVWLEDAFTVTLPDGTDVKAWAENDLDVDELYRLANDPDDPTARIAWEDEHKADLDFPEDEIVVESPHGEEVYKHGG